MRPQRSRLVRVATATSFAIVAVIGTASVQASSGAPLQIKVLGTRADLVSAGDALVEVVLPKGISAKSVHVTLASHDVTKDFVHPSGGPMAGRMVGRLEGLALGYNNVVASASGHSAELVITNYPKGGPIFSGLQVQPWKCTTVAAGLGKPKDAKCDASTTYTYRYRSIANSFRPYDPKNPPPAALIEKTTTDQGHTATCRTTTSRHSGADLTARPTASSMTSASNGVYKPLSPVRSQSRSSSTSTPGSVAGASTTSIKPLARLQISLVSKPCMPTAC